MRKKLLILAGLFIVLGAILIFRQDSFYSKQTKGEVILNTLRYSTENQIAAVRSIFKKEKIFALDVPLFKQEYAVTCELASLRMVLNYYGFEVSEDDLIAQLPFDMRGPMSNGVWGDPERGFVGDVNGSIFDGTGYGVHAGPIKKLAEVYLNTVELHEPDIDKVVGLVSGGKPVIVWGLLSSRYKVSWRTYEGKGVEVYPGEHARVVVGFTGEQHDPDKLILLDPIYGKIYMSVDEFVSDWEMMNKRVVVVR